MKRAVSVSLGSSTRDKVVEIELLGEQVRIERRGTDGDVEKATALFTELDGQVDALGVGGIDLWVLMG
ncbi:MAG: quinate 5-dehydrogenase, partial [Chloroflexi bacterium]|nr:quinate 5-dehydrogenase [Chloroflexota bacterium]